MGLVITSSIWAGYGGQGPSDEEAAWIGRHVGIYIWGPCREKERICHGRDELGDMAACLGARIVRSTLNMYPEPWRPEYDPTSRTFIDSLRKPDWRALIGRYGIIVLTLGDGSGRQFDPEWTKGHYRKLTAYLLREYEAAGKTFILGLWEGDHWLTEREMARNPANVERYIRYFEARHQGIVAGRADVPYSRSKVYEMIEMVSLDYEGQKYLINRVIPHTHADLYSLSSWGYQYELVKALDYIKSKAPVSAAFGRRNCMVGEAGGPADWALPEERIDKIRQILAQARQWGVPYVTWWELVGAVGEGQNSLRAPLYDGGVKFAPYYWFYRAYHNLDDPLQIEDFEVDPHGPAGGDYSEEGYPLNRIGGRQEIRGDVFSCLAPGEAQGQRLLYLHFGKKGGAWSTGLMHLDARHFSALYLALRRRSQATIALTDGKGLTARISMQQAVSGKTDIWRCETIALKKFARIDPGDLVELSITAPPGSELWVDEIGFTDLTPRTPSLKGRECPERATLYGKTTPSFPKAEGGPGGLGPAPKASHIMLQSSSQPLPVPAKQNRSLAWLRMITTQDVHILNPRISDDNTTVRLAKELLPGQVLEVLPGGTSHLRFGPLGHLLDVSHPEAAGLTINNLTGQPQFHSFQPSGDNGWLEWRWESDFPVHHFRIVLYGLYRQESRARAAILFSSDGKEWQEAALDKRNWDEPYWVGRPPQDFKPSKSFWVRFQLFPDKAFPDWPWTVGMGDFKIELWMDSEGCKLPAIKGLHYLDNGPSKGFRGLMDLDW